MVILKNRNIWDPDLQKININILFNFTPFNPISNSTATSNQKIYIIHLETISQ